MKIDSSARISTTPVRRVGKARRSGGSGDFASQMASTSEQSAPATGAASPVAVNPLLAAQEAADATSGATRAKAQAEAMLDRLDELRMGLLAGRLPRERLTGLIRLAHTSREPNLDSRLNQVLDEIELRAKVELAKLDIES
jgi:hypothetical protein